MWWTEITCNPTVETQFNRAGTIELGAEKVRLRKPVWLVAIKLLVLTLAFMGMIIATVLRWPQAPLTAASIATGCMLLYCLTAFFVRPQANTDNLGGLGGTFDDPFQYNDDINRTLLSLHLLLGPGRFAAQTVIEVAMLCGLVEERTESDVERITQADAEEAYAVRAADVEQRNQARWQSGPGGTMQLDSAKYLSQTTSLADPETR